MDWWITFNEANVFVINSYVSGLWPPGKQGGVLSLLALGSIRGEAIRALDLMADAHNEIYEWAHAQSPKVKVGVAHNMAHYTARGFIDGISAWFANRTMNWRFPSRIEGKMDFFGFNYYGAEWLKGSGVDIDPAEEYSDAGRAIDVNGLYFLLHEIHRKFPKLEIIITENGIADEGDGIRGAYLVEHLLAVGQAIKDKVPVTGYYYWTLTDNLEWSDGYCPKFGIVGVDRATFGRKTRPSFELFQKIISRHSISEELRILEWAKVIAGQNKDRAFCRGADGITAFDQSVPKKLTSKDWRFTYPRR